MDAGIQLEGHLRIAVADLWNALLSDHHGTARVLARVRAEFGTNELTLAATARFERFMAIAERSPTQANNARLQKSRRDLASLLLDHDQSMALALSLFVAGEAVSEPSTSPRHLAAAFDLVRLHRQLLRRVESCSSSERIDLFVPLPELARRYLSQALDRAAPGLGDELPALGIELGLADTLRALPARQAALLRRHFGLGASPSPILDDLGGRYALSHERINQLRGHGLRRVRRDLRGLRGQAPSERAWS